MFVDIQTKYSIVIHSIQFEFDQSVNQIEIFSNSRQFDRTKFIPNGKIADALDELY